jgi:hypothetical protein
MFGFLSPVGGLVLQCGGGFLEDEVEHLGARPRTERFDAFAD